MARRRAGRWGLLVLIAWVATACGGGDGDAVVPTLAPTLGAMLPPAMAAPTLSPTQTPPPTPASSPVASSTGASGHSLSGNLVPLTAQNAARLREVAHINQSAHEVALSPDGTLLAAALSDGSLHLWRTDTYAQVAAVDARSSWPSSLVFSPDGRFLVLAGMDERVSFWGVPGTE